MAVELDGWVRAVLEPGFGEGEVELVDGYAEADLGRSLRLRVGRFKTPFGYESLRSSSDLRFAERALPTALSPRRDLGAMLHGAWAGGHVEAAASVFNGVEDGGSEDGERSSAKDAVARLFARPLPGLGVGIAVAAGAERGAADGPALADYETSGGRPLFQYAEGVYADGPRLRLGPQGTLDAGPFHLLGEATWARHRVRSGAEAVDLTHRAWQVAASAVVVGAPRGDDRPRPRRPVTEGGPGAVEVSARLHGLRLDADSAPLADPEADAEGAVAWALALHWSPTAETRLGATVERTAFDGAGPRPAETFLVVRAQLSF